MARAGSQPTPSSICIASLKHARAGGALAGISPPPADAIKPPKAKRERMKVLEHRYHGGGHRGRARNIPVHPDLVVDYHRHAPRRGRGLALAPHRSEAR